MYTFQQCLHLLPDVSSIQTVKVLLFLGLNALYFPDEDYFGAVKMTVFILQLLQSVRFFVCFVKMSRQKHDILGCVSLFGS